MREHGDIVLALPEALLVDAKMNNRPGISPLKILQPAQVLSTNLDKRAEAQRRWIRFERCTAALPP